MLTIEYQLECTGFTLMAAAAAIALYDFYHLFRSDLQRAPRWRPAARLAGIALMALLMGLSISVIPAGSAGVVVSEISGTQPGTLYPGPPHHPAARPPRGKVRYSRPDLPD